MYARSSTIHARTSAIDEGIAHVRDEVMPAMRDIEGCMGLSLVVDRNSGRCIATSSWQSQEAMHASAERVRSIRDRAAEAFEGTTQVEEWEIALLHRDHPSPDGSCVRATWLQTDPAQMDHAIDVFRMVTLPRIQELTGFCSASLMVDRASGRAVTSVTYDSRESMERARDRAMELRSSVMQEVGGTVTDMCEFELAFAHLHVPEMA